MTNLIRSYAEFLIRIRVLVILAVIMITVFLGMQIAKLKIDMDPDIWAPQTHPYVKATKVLEETFVGTNFTLIGIVPKEGDIFQPDILAKIKRIQHGIEQIPEAVRHNVISLAARKVKDIRGTEEGMEVRPMLETIPQTPEEIDRLKKAVFSNPIYINSLVSPDGKAASVIADFKVNKENPSYAALYSAIRKVVDKERDGRVEIYMGGIPIVLNGIEFYMMKMLLYFAIALLIIILIQYWSFRTFQGMLLPIATALISVVWGLGFMGLTDVHMDAMGANTPILIMAVAAGHAIQILKRYYEEYHRLTENNPQALSARIISHTAVVESLVKVGPVMITAGLIAAITFYSLITSEISVVRHFGFFAGSGIIAALILEMTFIPSLRMLLPPPKARETEREQRTGILDRMLRGLADNLVGGRAPWILATILALVVLAFIGATRLNTDNSLTRYFVEESNIRIDDVKLNSLFGGTNSIFFLVEGQGQDSLKDPKVLQGMAALQDLLAKEPQVGKTQSIVDMIKRMNQAMHGDDQAYYVIPENRDLIAQYLLLYSMSGDPQDLDNFVDNNYQKGAIWVYVKDDSTAYAEELYRKAKGVIARNFPAGVTVRMGGGLPVTSAINEVLTHEKVRNMVQMALVVFLLSSIVFRSFVGGLFVAAPLVMIILANFGLMGWLGVPLDMGTAVAASMAIGIGADYEIYLLFRFREELAKTKDVLASTRNSLLTSGKAILFVAMSVAGGYTVLLTAGFGFYTRLAIMVIATMLCSSVSALLFLRSMMMIFKPRFIFGNMREKLFSPPKLILLIFLWSVTIGIDISKAETTPREIMEKNFVAIRVKNSTTDSTFTLINKTGQMRIRKVFGATKLEPNEIDNMRMTRFLSPPDVKGTVILLIEHSEKDDDIWIYLPGLKKVRRMLSSNKRDSFAGTDFSYGDVIGHKVGDWQHQLLKQEAVDGQACYVIESIPKNETVKENSGYSKRLSWIQKDNFVAIKGEFWDESGRPLKTLTAANVQLVDPIRGKWQPMRLEMVNTQTGHKTIIQMENFKANQVINDEFFTTRYMERE